LSFLDNQQQEKTPTLEIVLNFKDGSKQTLLINKPLESSLSSDNSKLIHNDSEDSSPYLAQFQTNNSGLVSVVISREVVKSLNKDPNFFLAN